MERATLTANARECGKGFARRLRADGKIPAVLYGKGVDPKPLAIDDRTFRKVLQSSAGFNVLIDLSIDSDKPALVRVKDYAVHPLKRKLTHVDFQAVDLEQKIEVEVPLKFEGNCIGVKEGGVMQVLRRSLTVECLPSAIPDYLGVDVTNMQVGELWYARDVKMPEGVEFDSRYEKLPVIQIVASKRATAANAQAESDAAAAPAAPAAAEGE